MLSVRWRPSGGRGEYEYIVKGLSVLGKTILVEIPALGTVLPTDVSFQIKDGKPRLRRANPNDRSRLNVAALVAAVAGLPAPRRQDQTNRVTLPLSDKSYVVDEVLFEVIDHEGEELLAKPRLIKIRNSDSYIDVEERIQLLLSNAGNPIIDSWAMLLQSGVNEAEGLTKAAESVHSLYPYFETDEVKDIESTSEVRDAFDEIVETYTGKEGLVKIRIHRERERDRRIVKIAKTRFELIYGSLFCECCGFDFEETYGELGKGFAEAHHRTPLSMIEENSNTSVEDLAMLCANCHRMIHRSAECSLQEVQSQLLRSNKVWSAANLALLSSFDSSGAQSHTVRLGKHPV